MSNKRVVGYFSNFITEQEVSQKYEGYTDLLFAFWVDPINGVSGAAEAIVKDPNIMVFVKSKGIKCILAAGGASYVPDSSNPETAATNGKAYGTALAAYAIEHKFDGVDLDIENIQIDDSSIAWLVQATLAIQKFSYEKDYTLVISHAPQAPYFLRDGGYAEVEKQTNNAIAYYNIQYYNQGTYSYQEYEDYDSIFPKLYEGQVNPTSIVSISKSGVPSDKLLVGKPITEADVNNTGYVPLGELCDILEYAINKDVSFGGVMGWKVDSDSGDWGETIDNTLNS
ncbi:MAG: hypothetical protein HRT38_19040 [Alteromonadaceae bacterium]|nr:hypothetical protein [Alteromonadaceae bacterium]